MPRKRLTGREGGEKKKRREGKMRLERDLERPRGEEMERWRKRGRKRGTHDKKTH